jgi:hypothetical protein
MISRNFARAAGTATALTAGLAAAATLALGAPAGAAVSTTHKYSFTTINNEKDLTFNQLLGINEAGKIAGYFGSGMAGHPNKGYTVMLPYHQSDFRNENFPHSAQTQVTGLNDLGQNVGFWANTKGANFGFYRGKNGKFHNVNFPGAANASPQVDQLLGINDRGVAVGFYTNSIGNNRGYEYNTRTHEYSRVLKPGTSAHTLKGTSLTVAAINNFGTVAGFYVNSKGVTVAFIKSGSHFTTIAHPGATMTQAFGVNDSNVVVGAWTVGSGSSAKTYGFTWTRGHGFTKVNDPHGIGTTIVNGVNDRGELVGFYVDSAGNSDGFLARPRS